MYLAPELNVLTIFIDRKMPQGTLNSTITSYQPVLIASQDYYPFGMQMDSRGDNSLTTSYRFGFNGKENDNEVYGDGNWQDYGMRMYNPRIGRFPSVDPLTKDYPFYTPYQFAGNKPIIAVDLDGGEEKIITGDNSYLIKATYIVEQKVLDNIDIVQMQNEINSILNSNLNTESIISDDLPQLMCEDQAKPTPLSIQFQIVLVPMSDNNIENQKIIYTKNGQSLGGKILMGEANDKSFIATDKDGNVLNDATEVPAYYNGYNIVLNPKHFDKSSPEYKGFTNTTSTESGVMTHEIGHDLNLKHGKGEYPEEGTMSPNGGSPTKEEQEKIADPKNDKIIQPGEKYE